MKKVLFAVAALATISTLPAIAADMRARPAPVYKAAPAMVAAYNWTGFYIGGQVGYQWNADDHTVSGVVPVAVGGPGPVGPFFFESDGAVYGGHAGFNWQAGQWVFGVEGDFEGSSVKEDFSISLLGGTATLAFEQKWQASLRARLGWALWDRGMIYATGGAAWADFENSLVIFAGPGGPLTEPPFGDTVSGWTIGAGAEWALWQNWTGRIEYRYTDFESFGVAAAVSVPGGSATIDNLKYHTVRAGLSWRFGDWGKGPMAGKGPVVGKY